MGHPKFSFMFFILINFTLSYQTFDVTSNSIKSLVLYFHPRHSIEVSVSSELQTYFSDMMKAIGLTVEIQTNNNSLYGTFNHRSHLNGIDFHVNHKDYKLIFTNEGNNDVQLALVFAENLTSSLNTINQNLKNFEFPISNYPSNKFKYFNNDGLIFHERKYSKGLFIGTTLAIAAIFIVIFIIGIPGVFSNCTKQRVSNSNQE